jgi:Fe(3+) dicitrate transport protein
VVAGDELPYVPEHQFTITSGIETDHWGVNTSANYVDEARAIAGQGTTPDNELIDGRWLVDFTAYIQVTDGLRAKFKVENLFDETYSAARRPAGLRPGKPQEILFGFEVNF